MARLVFVSLLAVSSFYTAVNAFHSIAREAYDIARSLPSTPLPPSKDPFYTAPLGYELAKPGDILRARPAPLVPQHVANCSAAYNILYRTTDSQYNPSWAVTTLLLPLESAPERVNASEYFKPGTALLNYQLPYDSANIDLSPSYIVYGGAFTKYLVPPLLGQGWYVNVPDFEGPKASFTAGVQSGHATLDSVRAILKSKSYGLHQIAPYAMAGYSGGALATEWAAELQVQYAPELNFAGVSLGGLTPNMTSFYEINNKGSETHLIANGILGIVSQWPTAENYVENELNPIGAYNASTFLGTRTGDRNYSATFDYQDIFQYFKNGQATLNKPAFRQVINNDGMMGYHGVPRSPLFVHKAIHDEISLIAETDTLVGRYCALGAEITYERNTVGDHDIEFLNGAPAQMKFLTEAFLGKLLVIPILLDQLDVPFVMLLFLFIIRLNERAAPMTEVTNQYFCIYRTTRSARWHVRPVSTVTRKTRVTRDVMTQESCQYLLVFD